MRKKQSIYYIGINEKLDYADNKLLTPFDFLHNDLTHAENRRNYGNREYEKSFIIFFQIH